MQLVDRHVMRTLPHGTVYQSWSPGCLGTLLVKVETGQPAGGPQPADGVSASWDAHELSARLDLSEDGQLELSTCVTRDGACSDDVRFVAYTAEEVAFMVDKLRGVPDDEVVFTMSIDL